jgi:hypothetical protein
MRQLIIAACLFVIAGCSTSASQYYEAVQKAAEANSAASQAKFDALAKIASSGDGQAASAAVMALALSATPAMQPIPQQSEALQWASVLATPVTSLGMMWMQADSAKTMARYNSQVDLARISAESADNQALYGAFVDSHQVTGDVIGNIDYTPFVDGMVTLGTTGMNGLVDMGDNLRDLGIAGFDANVKISTAGFDGLTAVSTAGFDSLTTVSTAGFDAMVTLDSGNNALFSDVWVQYQTSMQSLLDSMVNCSASTAADGSLSVTCE